MATIRQLFSTNQSITITIDSLANDGFATSDAIDNSTNKFISADLQITIVTDTGTSADGSVTVFFLRSADGGITYDTLDSNSEVLGTFNANLDTTTYIFSVDTANAGNLPSHWKLAIQNSSGATLDSSGNLAVYTGKRFESV